MSSPQTAYSEKYDCKSIDSVAPGNARRNNSDAGKKNADKLSVAKTQEREAKGKYEAKRLKIKVRRALEMERRYLAAGLKPISKEEVEALLQEEEDAAVAGPGKKAAKREALGQLAPKKIKEQKINRFFKPLNMGSYPPPVGSPAVKVKSPSAVFGSAFIEAGAIPLNLRADKSV